MKVKAVLLAAIAAVLFLPSVAQAWDLRGDSTAGDCLHVSGTINSARSNPVRGDAKLRWEIDGRSQSASVNYGPNAQTFVFSSGVPQDGRPHSLRVSWIDHDGDETAVNSYRLTCGSPAAPPGPPTPPVTPPSPPVPPKVCVPSGGSVDLHKTGSRSFELIGRIHHVRWRFAGERLPSLNGQKSVSIPGEGTGRVVVRFRANCHRSKLVSQVVSPTPPETAG